MLQRVFRKLLAKIRLKTMISLALIFVTILAVLFNVYFFTSRINETNQANTAIVSERIASQLEIACNRRISQYAVLQRSIDHYLASATSENAADTNLLLSKLLQVNPDIESVLVFNDSGTILYSASSSYARLVENPVIPLQYYSSVFPQRTFYTPTILNLFENQYEWVVPYVVSCNKYSAEPFYIMLNIRQAAFMDLLEETLIGQNGYSYLITDDGTLVAHPKQQYLYWGTEIDDTLLVACQNTSGTFRTTTNGQDQLIIIHSVVNTSWRLVCVVYGDDVLPWRSVYPGILSTLLLSVILLILLAFGISHFISQPIGRLQQSMVMLENGDLETVVPSTGGYYETQELSKTFHHMRKQIKGLLQKVQAEEREKHRLELYALKMQIQPHFLYNTLESLTWMIENGRSPEAVSMISSMSRLFRISLNHDDEVIPLETELEHVRSYLEIQQFRFEEQLNCIFDISDEALACHIVRLTLQPIVENALYHGIAPLQEPGELRIAARVEDDLLNVTISDNGFGMPPDVVASLLQDQPRPDGSGVGLSNIHRRIRLLYGSDPRCGLEVHSEIDVGTEVTLVFPVLGRDFNETS